MIESKNRVMNIMSFLVLLLSLIVHALHRYGQIFQHHVNQPGTILNLLLVIPIVSYAITLIFYAKNKNHSWLPYLNMLTFTFGSISIIAGGSGMAEYHFSIFMALAMLLYYEKISVLLISTVIFAVQHIAGFFAAPELVFGSKDYSFPMLCIHLAFVVLFIAGCLYQLIARKKAAAAFKSGQDDKFKQAIDHIVSDISASSSSVEQNSKMLAGSSSQLLQLTEKIKDITASLHQISDRLYQGSEDSLRSIEEISAGVGSIAETSGNVAESSSMVSGEVEKGANSASEAIRIITGANDAVRKAIDNFTNVKSRSEEIKNIASVISDISFQTNLLALNAGIEAVRAGEQGKGFSVVASEVRKLAEQSNNSSNQISEFIGQILHEIEATNTAMGEVQLEVEQGMQAIQTVGEALNNILHSSQKVAEEILNVSAISQQISASSEQIISSFKEISSTSGTVAESVQGVTSLSGEQVELIHASSELAITLTQLSEKFSSIIDKAKSISIRPDRD